MQWYSGDGTVHITGRTRPFIGGIVQPLATRQLARCPHLRHLLPGWFTRTGRESLARCSRMRAATDSTSARNARVFRTLTREPSLSTTTPYGGDEQLGGRRVQRSPHPPPPAADRRRRERRRVVIHADAHEPW